MRKTLLLLSALGLLTACLADESISGFAARDAVYHLTRLDGDGYDARATIRFPGPGQIAGNAPCNAYSARQDAPYPWFAARAVVATKRACPDLAAETAFFAALSQMTLAEISGQVLILSNDAGREMVFDAR